MFAGGAGAAPRYHRAVPALTADVPVFRTEHLPVGDDHQMHVLHAGTPGAPPLLLLHGGPGSGQSLAIRRGIDPARFHIIAPEQRGCGGSTPAGSTAHNTLPHLLADLRALRAHLGIERWLVVGGSWGATLAVAYAADEPQALSGLLLRASFLARPADIADFFDPSGRPAGAPWAALVAAAGTDQPEAMAAALNQVLQHGDAAAVDAAVCAWWHWEQALAGDRPSPSPTGPALAAQRQRLRVQAHYLANGCWMDPPLLQRAARVPPVPTLLLHGDADAICPPAGAHALYAALHGRQARAQLRWAAGAGHSPLAPSTAVLTAAALSHWADHGDWPGDDAWPAP